MKLVQVLDMIKKGNKIGQLVHWANTADERNSVNCRLYLSGLTFLSSSFWKSFYYCIKSASSVTAACLVNALNANKWLINARSLLKNSRLCSRRSSFLTGASMTLYWNLSSSWWNLFCLLRKNEKRATHKTQLHIRCFAFLFRFEGNILRSTKMRVFFRQNLLLVTILSTYTMRRRFNSVLGLLFSIIVIQDVIQTQKHGATVFWRYLFWILWSGLF